METPTMSFVMPSIRPDMWMSAYNYLEKTNVPFELIVCTPSYIPANISYPSNIIFIRTNVKLVQCYQIGFLKAKGEFISLMSDDTEVSPYAYDEAVDIYRKSNNYKTIVSLIFSTKIGGNFVSQMHTLLFPDASNGIQLPTAMGVMSRQYFIEMGGHDINFMQEDLDLYVRCIINGSPIIICDEGSAYEDRGDGKHDHHDASRTLSWTNDYYLARELWAGNNNINDWKNNLGNIKRIRPHEPFNSDAPDFLTKSQGRSQPKWD